MSTEDRMDSVDSYSLDRYIEDLRRISRSAECEDQIFRELGPLAQRLAHEKGWRDKSLYDVDPEQGFGLRLLHEEPDHTLAVIAIAWLPGRGVTPHNHGTWAVVAGVDGSEQNIRYRRTDDGTRPGHVVLEVKHDFAVGHGDLLCMKTGGMHSVRNETNDVTLSLHTYGRHINHTVRSQFDLDANKEMDVFLKVN